MHGAPVVKICVLQFYYHIIFMMMQNPIFYCFVLFQCIMSYGQVLMLCSPESDDYVQALATVSDILDHNAELGKKYSQIVCKL